MSAAVTLTFAGDSKSLDKTVQGVNRDLDSVSSHNAKAGQSFTDTSGKVVKTSKGVKDSLKGLTDGLAMVGISFPGEQAIAFASVGMDLARGAKDLAEGLGEGVAGALTKVKGLLGMSTAATEAQTGATEAAEGAQEGLNTTMEANPIGLIIGLVAGLAIGFYELYEHCTAFRDGVKDAFKVAQDVISGVWGWVEDHWPLLLAILTGPIGLAVLEIVKHWDSIKSGASTLLGWFSKGWSVLEDIIKAPFMGAFDAIKTAWNDTVGGFGIHIPAIGFGPIHTPSIDLTIPRMANGGRPTGPTLVGERGPEMFMPDGPGSIVPMRGGGGPGGGQGGTYVLQLVVDGKVLAETTQTHLLRKKRTTGALGLA